MTTFASCRLPPSKRTNASAGSPPRPATRTRGAAAPGARWGDSAHLVVTFLDDPGTLMKEAILHHMNRWRHASASVSFTEGPDGQVRITCSAGQGNWSVIGNEAITIPVTAPTMNLDILGIGSTSVVGRIVAHEAGHCLGLVHEHLRQSLVDRIDPELAIPYFSQLNGWSEAETRRQVLTAIADADLVHDGPPDEYSIMAYPIPGSITTDGEEIPSSNHPTARDIAFLSRLYPGP